MRISPHVGQTRKGDYRHGATSITYKNVSPINDEGQETVSRELNVSKVHSVFLDYSLDRKHDRIAVEIKIGDI